MGDPAAQSPCFYNYCTGALLVIVDVRLVVALCDLQVAPLRPVLRLNEG